MRAARNTKGLELIRVAAVGLATIAVVAFASPGTASAAPPKPGAVYDCDHRAEQPTQLLLACGDGAVRAKHLVWRTHTKVQATGHGVMALFVCNTNCPSGGHTIHRTFAFTLHRPKLSAARRVFTRLTVTYQHQTPGGKHQNYELSCGDFRYC